MNSPHAMYIRLGWHTRWAHVAERSNPNLNVISDWGSQFAADLHPYDGLIFCVEVANERCAIANEAEVSDAAQNGHKGLVNGFADVVSNR
jgi:hypothetical protein